MFQDSFVLKYLYFGFLGAMIINVLFPHLAATVVMKRYAPGLITGVTLILPINGLIIYFALKYHVIDWTMLVISTAFVGILLLLILRPLFRLGKLVKEYQQRI
ncbi:MAG: HXXEE domain-containing protein [Firmicutes bacterium]|nr:HXXEE domain-containing protein [Bacillota bacterium]